MYKLIDLKMLAKKLTTDLRGMRDLEDSIFILKRIRETHDLSEQEILKNFIQIFNLGSTHYLKNPEFVSNI